MLDIKWIRENPELLKKAAANKNFNVDIDALLSLDREILPKQRRLEELQTTRNTLSKEIPLAKTPEEREAKKSQVRGLKDEMEALTEGLNTLKANLRDLMYLVPQPAKEDVPLGRDDKENAEVMRWGTPRSFDFEPLDHVSLGEKLGILDIERGVKLAGSRSYVFKGQGALLENAILRYAYDLLLTRGFTPMSVPILVNEACMEGTGYFPLGKDQAYYVEKDKMALVGTSEVSLCSLHAGETLDTKDLPLRYMAQTACFRRESGTYGKDTRGIYRVHQFQKIEMVVFGHADKDETDALHAEILKNAEDILQGLKLPYRKVYVCTGDLGQGQVCKHDLETWMPSRNNYGETHSCSSFYDFQSRRLDIRYKDEHGNRPFVYTLNNTACAAPRFFIAILENYQTQDGRLEIPEVLRPYMNGLTHIG